MFKTGFRVWAIAIITNLFLFLEFDLSAQSLARIQRGFEKDDFSKVIELLNKSSEKDSSQVGVNYLFSLYYFEKGKPFFNSNRSNRYIDKAISLFDSTDQDQMAVLKEIDLGKKELIAQKQLIISYEFQQQLEDPNIDSLNAFMVKFPGALQFDQAIFHRDSLAYLDANKLNNWEGFQDFMELYPESHFFSRAKKKYDRLIYLDKTASGQLEDYESFLEEFEETPFRDSVESKIFTLSTKNHEVDAYLNYLRKYPNSKRVRECANLAYYLDSAQTIRNLRSSTVRDSLRLLTSLNKARLFPFLEPDGFSFIDSLGNRVIPTSFTEIAQSYRCGGTRDHRILARQDNGAWKLFTRNGNPILEKEISEYIPLGREYFVASHRNHRTLYHSSGSIVMPDIQHAELIGDRWIKVQINYQYGIINHRAEMAVPPIYDDIIQVGPFYLLEKDERYELINDKQFFNVESLNSESFEDYELLDGSHLLCFNEDKEALMDSDLRAVIPWEDQEIHVDLDHWVIRYDSTICTLKIDETEISSEFSDWKSNQGWLAFESSKKWSVHSRFKDEPHFTGLDSITLMNDYMFIGFKSDSAQLFHQQNPSMALKDLEVRRLNGSNSFSQFLMIRKGRTKAIINAEQDTIFMTSLDEIEVINDSLFSYEYRERKGILDSEGKALVRATYDAIEPSEELIYLLSEDMIGAYDPAENVKLDAKYERKIEKLSPGYLVYKNGKYQLKNDQDVPLLDGFYDEIKPWNDTAVWTRTDDLWNLISFSGLGTLEGIESISLLYETDSSQFMVIRENGAYGLVSNRQGRILDSRYTDIINIGSEDFPIIFAEQYLPMAEYHVITYFNISGEKLTSAAYRPEEYGLVFCDR